LQSLSQSEHMQAVVFFVCCDVIQWFCTLRA